MLEEPLVYLVKSDIVKKSMLNDIKFKKHILHNSDSSIHLKKVFWNFVWEARAWVKCKSQQQKEYFITYLLL